MESEAFDYLDSKIERITSWDVPLSYANNLENFTLPQIENIKIGILNTLKGYKNF